MGAIKNIAAGLGGAIALNLLHEALKHKKGTPRVDLVGEEALQKGLAPLGAQIHGKDNLYLATLGADLFSNTMYYSTLGASGTTRIWPRAIAMGLTAGIGAVKLPEPMGLDDEPVAGSMQKQAMTVGYYVFGALVTAALLKAMKA